MCGYTCLDRYKDRWGLGLRRDGRMFEGVVGVGWEWAKFVFMTVWMRVCACSWCAC